LAIFEPLGTPNHWQPSALAAGPFAGLQGGAVASLLTAEVEAIAGTRKWGTAVAVTAWFLRPTPMAILRTELAVVTEGGRVSVVDNTLWPLDEEHPSATVRVTLSRQRAVEVPGFADDDGEPADPRRFPLRTAKAAHDRPWFMDAMEARAGDDAAWFRLHHPIIDGAFSSESLPRTRSGVETGSRQENASNQESGAPFRFNRNGKGSRAGPLSSILGPADWTHGIARPFQNVVADPNPNLTVQLFRPPRGEWVGIRAQTRWQPASGGGVGSGTLLDVHGEIGRVSMSVVLVPFPKPAAAAS
jgi:hypothetical protein